MKEIFFTVYKNRQNYLISYRLGNVRLGYNWDISTYSIITGEEIEFRKKSWGH